uniref:Uncharacterized protein n=1 Tax=Arundo donax TaxID=35708 RepID=A0A0A9BKC2_ARUDO
MMILPCQSLADLLVFLNNRHSSCKRLAKQCIKQDNRIARYVSM